MEGNQIEIVRLISCYNANIVAAMLILKYMAINLYSPRAGGDR